MSSDNRSSNLVVIAKRLLASAQPVKYAADHVMVPRELVGELQREVLRPSQDETPAPQRSPVGALFHNLAVAEEIEARRLLRLAWGVCVNEKRKELADEIAAFLCIESSEKTSPELCKKCGAPVDHWMGCTTCGKELT